MAKYTLKEAKGKKFGKQGSAFPHFMNNKTLLKPQKFFSRNFCSDQESKRFLTCKKAVSEMVAYVILISIAMGLAVAIFAYLSYVVNIVKPPIDCKEGTSISLEDYGCNPLNGEISLTIRNNGRFNVDGIIVKFSDNASKEPVIMLKPEYSGTTGLFSAATKGHFSFDILPPGDIPKIAKFTIVQEDGQLYPVKEGTLKIIQIQPFIRDKKKVACAGTTIKQPLIDCHVA